MWFLGLFLLLRNISVSFGIFRDVFSGNKWRNMKKQQYILLYSCKLVSDRKLFIEKCLYITAKKEVLMIVHSFFTVFFFSKSCLFPLFRLDSCYKMSLNKSSLKWTHPIIAYNKWVTTHTVKLISVFSPILTWHSKLIN